MNKEKKQKNKKPRKKFLAVDVWRSKFGPTSVRAIYDVYATAFNVEIHNIKDYSFSHCVNALRKLENPNYIASQNASSYS